MRKTLLLTVAVLAGIAAGSDTAPAMPLVRLAHAAAAPAAAKSAPDTSDYVRATVMGDMFEIEAAKVAQTKSRSGDVQNFATTMIREYGAMRDELSGILRQNSFGFTPPAKLDDEHTAMVHELQTLANDGFDRLYLQQQIQSHQAALRVQSEYARAGRDQLLRKYGAKTAPKIRAHLELAKQVFTKMSRVASRSR